MTIAVVILGVLNLALIGVLLLERHRHDKHVDELLAAARQERAQLINMIKTDARIPDGRPIPKPRPARSPETLREFARVGTVRPPTPSQPGDDAA